MKTYQDLERLTDQSKESFVREAIDEHKMSAAYREASIAQDYARQQNTTIMAYQKMLYDMAGRAKPDLWSPNYKLCSNFFDHFVTQQVQYLLGNGCSWQKENTSELIGNDFDNQLRKADKSALIQGVSFGFMNLDHLDVFELTEFVPLYDEENGALMAGIRFWQVDLDKPLRATLYETDGYTDYLYTKGKSETLIEKRPYKQKVITTQADGEIIYDGENYPSFPIVPLWANHYKQSELVGLRGEIDAYDFIKSGFANELDGAQLYWVINNAGGMDDIDMAKFIERLKTVHAASVETDGATAESHTVEIPYAARKTMLDQLRSDMYEDYMALDVKGMAGGSMTATYIRAAYEPLNAKADEHQSQVTDFVRGVLSIVGIDDKPTFNRSTIVNVKEEIETVLLAANYLSEEFIMRKVLSILGDSKSLESVFEERQKAEATRFNYTPEEDNI